MGRVVSKLVLLAAFAASAQSGLKVTLSSSSDLAVNVSVTGGSCDSLVVTHRELSPLSDAVMAVSGTTTIGGNDLKVIGVAKFTNPGTLQALTLPEAGVYWVFAKRQSSDANKVDSVWTAARFESTPAGGRLTSWYDAGRGVTVIRVAIPPAVELTSIPSIKVGQTEVFKAVLTAIPDTGIAEASVGSKYLAAGLLSNNGNRILWMSVATSSADSVDVQFPVSAKIPKPIILHNARSISDPTLEGTAHLLERLSLEDGNPLLSAPAANMSFNQRFQLSYWRQLVESVPTWNGYIELLSGLLTLKKGGATGDWNSATRIPLTRKQIQDSLSASLNRPIVARNTQQNLTGPVY